MRTFELNITICFNAIEVLFTLYATYQITITSP